MSLLDRLPRELREELGRFLLCTRLVAIFEITRGTYQITASYVVELRNAYATVRLRDPSTNSLPDEALLLSSKYASLETPDFAVFCPPILNVRVRDTRLQEVLRWVRNLSHALNYPTLVGLPRDAPPSFRALADAVCVEGGPVRHRAVLTTYHAPTAAHVAPKAERGSAHWELDLGLFKVEFADDAVAGLDTTAAMHQLQN